MWAGVGSGHQCLEEAHERRTASSGSSLTGEERKGVYFQPLSGRGFEPELCLSGKVTTTTAPGLSPEDRVTHLSTALSLPSQEPLCFIDQ